MKLIYPLFELAYGEAVQDNYSGKQLDDFDKRIDEIEESRGKEGYIHFDNVDELIPVGLTEADKRRLKKFIQENADK